jgi:hypothetical protein
MPQPPPGTIVKLAGVTVAKIRDEKIATMRQRRTSTPRRSSSSSSKSRDDTCDGAPPGLQRSQYRGPAWLHEGGAALAQGPAVLLNRIDMIRVSDRVSPANWDRDFVASRAGDMGHCVAVSVQARWNSTHNWLIRGSTRCRFVEDFDECRSSRMSDAGP